MSHFTAEVQVGQKLIGQLVEHTGLEPKTIRFYERAGLLSPKRIGRLRIYTHNDVERLKVIKLLRQFDLSIRAIQTLIEQDAMMRVDDLSTSARDAITEQLIQRKADLDLLYAKCSELNNFAVEKSTPLT